MNQKLVSAIFIFILFGQAIFSQKKLEFEFDFAKFKYDNNSVFLEIYYVYVTKSLIPLESERGLNISAKLNVNIIDSSENTVIDENYNLEIPVDTTLVDYANNDLIGVLSYNIPFGHYKLKIIAKDNNSTEDSLEYIEPITFESFTSKQFSISDIELAKNIIKEGADLSSIYYKNGLEITPNPQNVYNYSSPILFYYSEIYNNSDNLEVKNYKFQKLIFKDDYPIFEKIESIMFANNSIVKVGFINLNKYPTGIYNLVLNLLDEKNNPISNSTKKFYFYNPNIENEELAKSISKNYISSEFVTLNEEECDKNFEYSKYIATPKEIDLYKTLNNLESKQKFLFEFWQKRDLEPITPQNEYKEIYLERANFVNSNYGNKFKEGYKSDRGRIYLLYGKPDRIDNFTNESTLKPYQIWHYEGIEGGVYFIFGDIMGISDLELLHSTKRGEVYDLNWQNRLSIF